MKIIAPYRFVNLHEKVFYPKDEEISFDVPYKDEQSGVIDIKIIAKSPIFVGDKKSEDDKEVKFFKIDEKFCIPSSSIRGVVRTLAEVLSFAKLKTQDLRLSYRDLNNPSYEEKAMDQNKIFKGWLYKKANLWYIEDLGKVKQNTDRILYFSKKGDFDLKAHFGENIARKIQKSKTAHDKYSLIKNRENLLTHKGLIVFTGTTGRKTREFLFPNQGGVSYELSKEVIKTFKQAYYIDTVNESLDWRYWSDKFEHGEKIPVFFQKDSTGNIMHFGLSMLYKLPYEKSTLDLLKQTQINYDDDKLDMVERIFGYVKKDEALKSRVNFSNFYTHNAKELQPISLTLSSPRPTFYPYYILQGNDTCFTYDDANAKLSGFKFYIPKNNMYQKNNKENPKIDTKIQVLDKGAVFEGKMRYFNLTPQELGLLLLTLSVFDSQEYYYKIGGAKAFGYGDCHIQINFDNEKLNTLISQYKQLLQENGFDIQKQIEKLKSIAKKMPNDVELKYLELKDFANIKKQMREKCKNKPSQKNFNHKPKKSYDKHSTQSKDEPNNPFGNLKQLLF
ncbi:TIGR03986 family type III CRISPR-associated RAMP protein [Campylobacter lari]|uniref:TIGR03986 family type III CRISPR-associated RAMP protein n=1 Tax=Campylobacter lari TaxID=201 RepID=UPI00130C242E|nr:TIGR03986 family CRISPR-associated RAMP protein [Campylobacter lari]MBT0822066.1 TIGR03986 family CRISPR-associated RAMP protein [Campylobacter lari]MBT0829529.1 TIGR03986 family CRISPR-associated RAMP protein [Campylobacter lari]